MEKKLRDERQRQDAKERFLIGVLRANDKRLAWLGEPGVQETLGAFVCLRGWYSGRAMIVTDPTGDTYVDVTPWDPLHFYWGMGPRGLRWACYKSKKTVQEVQAEYPGLRITTHPLVEGSPSNNMDDAVEVLEYYDEYYNAVLIDGQWAKPPTEHMAVDDRGRPRVPVFFSPVGHLPLIQSLSTLSKKTNITYHGESIFSSNRDLYPKINLVLSTILQLVALARNQAFTYMSRDGSKTLKESPFLEGTQTPLAQGEEIKLLELMKTAPDTEAFLGFLTGEVQRGALPYSTYGQLAFQLSGYAVNLLKQATDAPVVPRQQAVEKAYRQICALISDQYATGYYPPMMLSGRANNRDWFEEEFGPEMIQGVGAPEISLVVSTLQDDLQKMQMATMARQPINGMPTLDDRYIRDEILEIQDADSMDDRIREQLGGQMLPAANLYETGKALWEMGRQDLAMIYLRAAAMADMTGMLGQALGGGGQNGKSPGGPSSQAVPPEAQGLPEGKTPNPQAGSNVAPGSPRPGARGQSN